MNDTIHRDVFNEVMAEFNWLNARYPDKSTDVKMYLAKEYVRARSMADTVLLLRNVFGGNKCA